MRALIQSYRLHGMCKNLKEGSEYVHFTASSATKLERFYISQDLITYKIMSGVVATTFTYHNAVLLFTHTPKTEQLG
jgi:hypothetical protein